MKIEIDIPADAIERAVIESLTRNYARLDGKTLLGGLVTKAIQDQAEFLQERVCTIVSEIIHGEELERRIRQAFRNSVIAEAEKIGQKVARAMAMKEQP